MASSKNPFGSKAVITENADFSSTNSIDISKYGTDNNNSKEKDLEYNPFEHRKTDYPNSDLRSFANLLKSSLGLGILSMPAAFKSSGYLTGVVGTIVLGYLCTHCVYMLVETSQRASRVVKKPFLGYSETAEAVFDTGPKPVRFLARSSKIFCDWALILLCLGGCTIYVVFLADSVKQIVERFSPDRVYSNSMYCLMLWLPLAVFTQIRSLKHMAPFSALANILLIATFAICGYYIFQEPDELSLENRHMTQDVTRLPQFVSTAIFAMESITLVLPIENTMRKPNHFLGCPGVLNITMIVVVTLYTLIGFLGYIKYGDALKGSITLNLPVDETPALITKFFITFSVFFTYILQLYAPTEIVWRNFEERIPLKYQNLVQIIMRVAFVTLTVVLAAVLRKLEEIIGLVGAIFFSLLGFVVPAIMDAVFCWDRDIGKYKWRFWKDSLIVIFGIFLLITGCIQSFAELFK